MIFVAVTVTQTFQPATKEAAPAEQKTMGAFHSAQNGMEWTIWVRFDRNVTFFCINILYCKLS